MTPGGELVGPGLDGVDIAARLVRHEGARPAVVAVHGHRLAPPLPVDLAAPDQRRGDHLVSVAVDIGPHLDGLADDPFDGKRPPSIEGKTSSIWKAPVALSTDCVVLFTVMPPLTWKWGSGHRKETCRAYIESRSPSNGSRGNARRGGALDTLSPSFFWTILRRSPVLCVQTACRMNLFTEANNRGIQTEFLDGQGHRRVTDAAALEIILNALPPQSPGPLAGPAGRGPARAAGAKRTPARGQCPGKLENRCGCGGCRGRRDL